MLKIKTKDVVPPGGWRYTTPETGYLETGAHYWQLEQRVRGHRMANGLPMDNWKEVFEDGLCRQLGIEHSHCGQTRPISAKRRVHVDDVYRFLDTVAGWWTSGKRELVSQKEADRRAGICAACPQNIQILCPGCKNFVARVFGKQMRGKRTAHEGGLKSCGVCGCQLSVKVWLPLDVDNGTKSELEYPDFCWAHKKNESE